jgi:hypothetical protein
MTLAMKRSLRGTQFMVWVVVPCWRAIWIASFGSPGTNCDGVKGSPDAQLHAASLGHPPRLDDGVTVMRIIASTLKQRIIDIARWTPFTEVNVIFESSRRADPLVQDAFSDFAIEENGKAIPVECFFMPESAGDPGLEVADFVIHAVGRQARRKFEGREGFAPDFAAVFHNQGPIRVSFIDMAEVKRNGRGSDGAHVT